MSSKTVRLGIAQVLTVIRQQQKKALREAYADKVRPLHPATACSRMPHVALHPLMLTHAGRPCFVPPQKYKPLDLRPKKTRAIRRRLTPAQAGAKTERAIKKARHFPQRRFAVKA